MPGRFCVERAPTSSTKGFSSIGELQALIDDYQAKAARLGYAPMQGWFCR
jgi:hypothetical protein